jgi:hypothetical protein
VRARGSHELDDPAAEHVVDVDVLCGGAELVHVVHADDRPQVLERMTEPLVLEDAELVVYPRIAEGGAEEEAIELRLGERKGALILDGVVRREQEERMGELSGDAVRGDLPLGHRLEQRGLGLRSRAVDLVDEDHVREDRPGAELEVARLLVEDREPRHVGRLEVGRALDP